MSKMLTDEEYRKWFTKKHPIQAFIVKMIAYVIVFIVPLCVAFIILTALFVGVKWAFGVWS